MNQNDVHEAYRQAMERVDQARAQAARNLRRRRSVAAGGESDPKIPEHVLERIVDRLLRQILSEQDAAMADMQAAAAPPPPPEADVHRPVVAHTSTGLPLRFVRDEPA
jgi:uncharacterized membrane protein YccC